MCCQSVSIELIGRVRTVPTLQWQGVGGSRYKLPGPGYLERGLGPD